MSAPARRPLLATYRLQLAPDFGFDDAAGLVPYLAELGVSHLYLSPVFEAVAGSAHGYDAVDPTHLRDELGGAPAFGRLVATAHEAGLGLVLDIVPHHLAADQANGWWWDVLRRGRASRFAEHFDIDWDPPERRLKGLVLLPVLGDHYGRAVDNGELRLDRLGDELVARYYDHVAPLSPETADELWADAARRAVVTGKPADETLAAVIEEVNADPDALDGVLNRQHHRFARWQAAAHELDYRRFFDVDSLVALRSERLDVFADTHRLVTSLTASGAVDGLRVDHVDGLRDPEGYLDRLRGAAPEAWLVVEKILRPGESLPDGWPVDGTTGYDGLADIGGLLIDPAGLEILTAGWRRFTDETRTFDEIRLAARRETLAEILAADVERVVALLVRFCEHHRQWRDFTRAELRDALVEVTVHVAAYRTYESGSDELLADAVAAAGETRSDLDPDLFALLRSALGGELHRELGPERGGGEAAELAARWRQLTGPVAAKGEEDTAFYRWTPLLSVAEVGCEPDHPVLDVDRFHAAWMQRGRQWPSTMVTTSTHDTKRSEDVRARLAVLSEPAVAAAFVERVEAWTRNVDDDGPDRATQWLVFQTLVGAHPLPAERAWPVIQKSLREAKQRTSWVRPDDGYEEGVREWLESTLADRTFFEELDALVVPLVEPGRINALTQVALRSLVPGVPDTYRGTELWDLSLVDPDNRRPVDWDERRTALASASRTTAAELWTDDVDSGAAKLALLRACLQLRGRHPGAFGPRGDYRALAVEGPPSDVGRVLAFSRTVADVPVAAVVVPRFPAAGLADDAIVHLPAGRWHNPLTGAEVDGGAVTFATVRGTFPLAVLESAAHAGDEDGDVVADVLR
jgi:(1->4)-alpha-D-glucan 1-alpha-D-glucosylmutase